jgi:predicted RNA-binding Zn ribbon-like protein
MGVLGEQKAFGEFQYELLGGALCLDFVNTLDGRFAAEPKELLTTYADLLSWGEQAGALTSGEARGLRRRALDQPSTAGAILKQGRELRETLFYGFSAAAAGQPFPVTALDRLNKALPAALARLRVEPTTEGYSLQWHSPPEGLDRVLWAVVRSAADLLTSPELSRVRECPPTTCGWLFLDKTKSRTRRWCEMSTCGNQAKARRYRARRKRPAVAQTTVRGTGSRGRPDTPVADAHPRRPR